MAQKRQRVKRLAGDKHPSLLVPFFNYEDKRSVVKMTPGVNVIKLFSFVTDEEAQ